MDLQKIENPELRKFNGKLCTLYLYGTMGFEKKLISRTAKIQREIVYIIYVQNVWICRKIEYLELRKFNGKLCTLYVYEKSGFAENLNIQNCKNSTGNCVHYICTKRLDSQKI